MGAAEISATALKTMKNWFGRKKDRLVILLGAGSTISACAPTTRQITDHVKGLKIKWVDAIVQGLAKQRGKDDRGNDRFTFDTILHALEEIDSFILRKKIPNGLDSVSGVLSAFTIFCNNYANLESCKLLADRFSAHASIAKYVWEKTRDACERDLSVFFDRLRSRFQLSIFTLNYDDVVDRTGNWFDGFTDLHDLGNGAPYLTFNPAKFRAGVCAERDLLAHLHGSVRFGHALNVGNIVKYHCTDNALKSLNLSGQPTIISGHKETRLAREIVPFGYYYHALIEAVMHTPRLLVAGFGGYDSHVLSWLMAFMEVHGCRNKVALVDTAASGLGGPKYLSIKGCFPPADEDTVKILSHLR